MVNSISTTMPILQPVVCLVAWSLVIFIWMYATRLPAMRLMRIKLDPTIPPKDLLVSLPAHVRWKADNYNHLMEAPTLFYAIALVLALVAPESSLALSLAWAYVVLRVLHSLVQVTYNRIMTRFILFVASNSVLIGMTLCAMYAVF